MSKKKLKLDLEFVPSNISIDYESLDSKSSLVQLMLQVVKIGLRVDENGINSSIINKENKNEK